MKYLLLLAILVVAYLLWRNARLEQRRDPPSHRAPPPAAGPQEMVACSLCGLHLPQPDALRGGDGRFYCSQEHRLRAGG